MNVGIIGCGAVFEAFYLDALRRMEAAGLIRVGLLVDRSSENLERSRQYFSGAQTAQDLNARALAQKVDRVIVLTPPASHAALALRLADAGIHMYCEKPLTISPEEARSIAQAFSSKDLICKVGYVRRMFHNLRAFRSLYSNLGAVRQISISDGEVYRWPIKTAGAFSVDDPGSGVVWDKLCHNLDLVQWTAGLREIVSVDSTAKPGRVPVDVLVQGKTDHGTFRIAVSWTAGLPNLVSAGDGTATIRCKNGLADYVQASPGLPQLADEATHVSSYGEAVRLSLEEFFRLQGRQDKSSLATAEESVVLTEFLSKINALARRKVNV